MLEEKIKTLDELAEIVVDLKRQGKKIVHCHGVFDLLHYGHILHFISSKRQGDILIITVTPDRFVKKGPERPFFNEEIRLRHLAALECVDYVALNKWETAVETIIQLKPDIYSKGKEVLANANVDEIKEETSAQSNLSAEIKVLESFGGKLHLTDEVTFSSSHIINQITTAIPDETKEDLRGLKQKFKPEELINILTSLKGIRVLVIGDSILDEYIYCKGMGKSGKENLVTYKFLKSDLQLGGVFAVANNIANFTNDVSVVTFIGDNSYEYIYKNLNRNIEANLIIQNDNKTLIKTRYIDDYKRAKLFEVYNIQDHEIKKETEEKIINYLDKNLSRFDIVILADFGHGFFSQKLIVYLSKIDKFLAVNCQLNGGNLGYNFITKYKKVDFVFLNEEGLRFPFQEKNSDILIPIKKLNENLSFKKLSVTLGKFGSIHYQDNTIYRVNSFTQEPWDTMGAGDAVFALSTLLAYKNVEPILVPFLGNCIGALAVRIIGHTSTVDLIELKKFISYIMK